MQLSNEQRVELAKKLVDRMPSYPARQAAAVEAGMADLYIPGDPQEAWEIIIEQADARGLLEKMMTGIVLLAPGDTDLAEVADRVSRSETPVEVVSAGPDTSRILMIGAGVVGFVALGTLLIVIVAGMEGGEQEEADVLDLEAVAPTLVVPSGVPPALVKTRSGLLRTPATAAPEAETKTGPGGCTGPTDVIIGYAYVGVSEPVVTDGQWSPGYNMNVRVEMPTADNGYNATSAVTCVVTQGSAVNVGAPVEASGGTWWVPIKGSGS